MLCVLIFHFVSPVFGSKSRHWVGPNVFFWNDKPPSFRSGHGVAALGNHIYLFGGYGPSGMLCPPRLLFLLCIQKGYNSVDIQATRTNYFFSILSHSNGLISAILHLSIPRQLLDLDMVSVSVRVHSMSLVESVSLHMSSLQSLPQMPQVHPIP